MPSFNPSLTYGDNFFINGSSISIVGLDVGEIAYYTTDGTDPHSSSTKMEYSVPIIVDRDFELKVIVKMSKAYMVILQVTI